MTIDRKGNKTVVAVIVCFRPAPTNIIALLDSLVGQVDTCILVDNGSDDELAAVVASRTRGGEYLLRMSENLGIGAAQNVGIQEAINRQAGFVLLLDHDSLPQPNMVAKLISAFECLAEQGEQVGVVGPAYIDGRHGIVPVFVRVRSCRLARVAPRQGEDTVKVDHLIASGSLIPTAVLEQVGMMDATLFIDYVDVEWCLRARHHGFHAFGCSNAFMSHSLGDAPIRFLGRTFPSRSPLRHYYTFRNAVLLSRMSHAPLHWKLANGISMLVKFFFYAALGEKPLRQIRMMSLGILHGIMGRRGPFVLSGKSRQGEVSVT